MTKDDDDFDDLFQPRKAKQLARREDLPTSKEAAEKIVGKLRELQMKVYYVLLAANPKGLTDWELEEQCGSHGSTYRTRRAELTAKGLVVDTGRKRTIYGRNRVVWAVREYQK